MSEWLLDLVVNVIGGILEITFDGWTGSDRWSDCVASPIFWGVIILLLSVLIWWELR